MKELSIEEKAKAYDEIIEKATKMHNENCEACKACIEELIPELKESEDERIIKALIDVLKSDFEKDTTIHGITVEAIIAWLEKQGEHKPIIEMKSAEESLGIDSETYNKIVDECIYGEQKPTNKVEPKFKVGDFIVNDYCMGKVIELTNDAYLLDTGQGIPFSCEHNTHLWTIQEAKDGDVLACENGWTCIFKTLVNDETFSSYCFMDNTKWFCETGSECYTLNEEFIKAYNGKICPATKEQRDTLERVITNAGYRWNKEKLKLEKL